MGVGCRKIYMLHRRLNSRSVPKVRTRRVTRLTVAALLGSSTLGLLAVPAAHAAPAPSQRAAAEYIVKKDDYLFAIAKKLGTPLADLLAANSMTVTSAINPGDHLVVPASATNPTASHPTATPAAPAVASATYTVQSGDYLFGIARALGTSLTSLLVANSMTATSAIDPGDQLVVPATATNPNATPAAAPAAATSTYTVKAGDYLFGIARLYNIKLGTLLQLNDLKSTSVVLPGATLKIPAGAVAITTAPGQAASAATPPPPSGATKAEIVVAYAKAQLGKPYRFNTAGPDTFDCSGLSAAAYAQVGLWLPHQSAMQSTRGVAVDWRREDIKAGDLVFMYSSSHPGVISHLGIAINSWQWIHAPRSGDVVRIGLIPSDDVVQAVRRYVTD